MADTTKSRATLLDEVAALHPSQWREVAKELRKVAETFVEVPDGGHTAHTLGLLAHILDPVDRHLMITGAGEPPARSPRT